MMRCHRSIRRPQLRHVSSTAQAQHQDDGQHHLQDRDVPIAPRPTLALRERIAHDVGADRCADAPHAVQPAHMPLRSEWLRSY